MRGKVAFHVKTDVMHIVIVQPCEDGQLVAVDAVPYKLVGGFIDLYSAAFRRPLSQLIPLRNPDVAVRLRHTDAGRNPAEEAFPAQCLPVFPAAVGREDERVMGSPSTFYGFIRGLDAPHGLIPECPFVFGCTDGKVVISHDKNPP